jgi:hypothetical protein
VNNQNKANHLPGAFQANTYYKAGLGQGLRIEQERLGGFRFWILDLA